MPADHCGSICPFRTLRFDGWPFRTLRRCGFSVFESLDLLGGPEALLSLDNLMPGTFNSGLLMVHSEIVEK